MQPRTEITHRATSAAWRILNMVEQMHAQHTEKLESDSKILASHSARKSRLLDEIADLIESEFIQGDSNNGKDLSIPIATVRPARVGKNGRARA